MKKQLCFYCSWALYVGVVCVCVCATQLGWKAVTAQVMDQHECVCYEHTIAVKQGAMFFDGDETPVASG